MSDLLERITIDPRICHGKPVVRGLRYPVEMLLELMSAGMTAEEINELSVRDRRVLITKDTDFVDSFLLLQRPHKLLLISTDNIANANLESLFVTETTTITEAFESYDYLELTRTALVFHS